MAVVTWSPWQELEAMERRMRRLFDDAGIAPAVSPNADVYETDDAFVIEVEAPGYEEKDLRVELSDHTLTVKGERREAKETKEKAYQLNERLQASFERRFTLPADVDSGRITATFAKGVLEIHAAKSKEAAPKKVSIKAG